MGRGKQPVRRRHGISNDFIKGLKQYFVAVKISYVIKIRLYRNWGLQSLSQETAISDWVASS